MQAPFRGPPLEILATEIVYFIVLFTLCMIIYVKTKPLYDLTKHKGIFFFRNIFLFFGLTYLARFLFINLFVIREIGFHMPMAVHQVSLILVGYFSTMAVLCLVLTAVGGKWTKNIHHAMYWLSLISIIISVLTFGKWAHQVLILIHGVLLLFAVVWMFIKSHGKKARSFLSHAKITYLLIFIFWLLNVITFTRGLIPPDFKFPMYVLNVGVFFWVVLRVQKRLPDVKKKR